MDMAKIRTPKSLQDLFAEHDARDIFTYLPKYGVTSAKGEYLHWDKFKWKVAKGDNDELAWLATKYARKSISKQLPLLAEHGESFSYCLPDSLFAKLHEIDKMTGGGHDLGDGMFISSREKDRYLVKSLMMEEAITSSQLEGASTTRKVAKEMLKSQRAPKDKSEQMIFNNFILMKHAVENKDEDLSIDLILEFHSIATHRAIDNDAISGEFREDNDILVSNIYNEVSHEPPCHNSIIDRIQELCDFANETHDSSNSDNFIHPIIKAVILHFMIGFIHPFGDGNGRTARALFYWSMLRSGYWLFEYVSISKLIQEKRNDYDTAFVYTETDDFDLTYFLYHQVDIIIKAVNSLHLYIESKKQEYYNFMQWIEKSPIASTLKRGHQELLKTALKEPGKVFTAKLVATEQDVNENTARSYLKRLVDLDLLIESKSKHSKAIRYVAPANLKELLKI